MIKSRVQSYTFDFLNQLSLRFHELLWADVSFFCVTNYFLMHCWDSSSSQFVSRINRLGDILQQQVNCIFFHSSHSASFATNVSSNSNNFSHCHQLFFYLERMMITKNFDASGNAFLGNLSPGKRDLKFKGDKRQ